MWAAPSRAMCRIGAETETPYAAEERSIRQGPHSVEATPCFAEGATVLSAAPSCWFDSYFWKYFLFASRTAATWGVGRPAVSGVNPPPFTPKNRKLKSNPFWV